VIVGEIITFRQNKLAVLRLKFLGIYINGPAQSSAVSMIFQLLPELGDQMLQAGALLSINL
jgi:hypothetical protein